MTAPLALARAAGRFPSVPGRAAPHAPARPPEDQRADDSFQGPSTIARARDRYLVVNPDFATSTPPFTVTALPR